MVPCHLIAKSVKSPPAKPGGLFYAVGINILVGDAAKKLLTFDAPPRPWPSAF